MRRAARAAANELEPVVPVPFEVPAPATGSSKLIES